MQIGIATQRQLLRYGVTGIVSNAALYAAYLAISAGGVGPKVAMSIVYCAGGLATFIVNRGWTFAHDGRVGGAFARYVATYALIYAFNMGALALLVDAAGMPHRWVVLALILLSAGITFALHKFWVFPVEHTAAG